MSERVKNFTDEEVSRILSHAHELRPFGRTRTSKCCEVGCINQAAYNIDSTYRALAQNVKVGLLFDNSLKCERGTPDLILMLLEKVGAI
jgi:hypothetical protein